MNDTSILGFLFIMACAVVGHLLAVVQRLKKEKKEEWTKGFETAVRAINEADELNDSLNWD